MLVEFVIFVVFLLLFWYHTITKKWTKFQSRGLPYAKPYFPFGSVHNWNLLFSKNGAVSEQWKVKLLSYNSLLTIKYSGLLEHRSCKRENIWNLWSSRWQ